jgi:hypothetical protein
VQILALAWGPGAASATVSEERGVRRVLIGVGSTWSERDGYHDQARFGAMLGFEANLNRNLAMGFLGDITSIDDIPDGNHHRLLTGLDLKLLPLHGDIVRPWVMVGVTASFLDGTGAGYGAGAGAFFLPNERTSFFVDVRRYHIGNWDASKVNQVMLRAGVAF